MFGKNKKKQPLLVEVTETDWFAYGDPSSPRSAFLYKMLTLAGGINESVQPGRYHFDVERRFFKYYSTLEPAND